MFEETEEKSLAFTIVSLMTDHFTYYIYQEETTNKHTICVIKKALMVFRNYILFSNYTIMNPRANEIILNRFMGNVIYVRLFDYDVWNLYFNKVQLEL